MFHLLKSQYFRQKAISLNNHVTGPFRCVEESELCTTPDDECSTLDELFQRAVTEHTGEPCLGRSIFIGR